MYICIYTYIYIYISMVIQGMMENQMEEDTKRGFHFLQALGFRVHDVLISSWVYEGCRMFQRARTQNP